MLFTIHIERDININKYLILRSWLVENLIGKGGHAEVFKGRLADGQDVAVKRLMTNGKEAEDRAGDFLSELGIIGHVNHPNAARLIGFGVNNGLFFVLQLASYGSLSSLLFGALSKSSLYYSTFSTHYGYYLTTQILIFNLTGPQCMAWNLRFKVAIGVAKGLHYLHHDCPRRIIHRDIKASNILLNANYEAEVSWSLLNDKHY